MRTANQTLIGHCVASDAAFFKHFVVKMGGRLAQNEMAF